jgi:hypothetical protein
MLSLMPPTEIMLLSYSGAIVLPVISTVAATPAANGTATISWTTDVPSDSRVDYGTTANNLTSNQSNAALVTNHRVLLP